MSCSQSESAGCLHERDDLFRPVGGGLACLNDVLDKLETVIVEFAALSIMSLNNSFKAIEVGWENFLFLVDSS